MGLFITIFLYLWALRISNVLSLSKFLYAAIEPQQGVVKLASPYPQMQAELVRSPARGQEQILIVYIMLRNGDLQLPCSAIEKLFNIHTSAWQQSLILICAQEQCSGHRRVCSSIQSS